MTLLFMLYTGYLMFDNIQIYDALHFLDSIKT